MQAMWRSTVSLKRAVFSLLAIWASLSQGIVLNSFLAERLGLGLAGQLNFGLVLGVLLLAFLALVAAPGERLRRAIGVPPSGAERLCLGGAVVLGLFGLALGWAAESLVSSVRVRSLIPLIRTTLIFSCVPLILGQTAVENGWIAQRVTMRLVALLFLGALSLPVVVVVQSLLWPGIDPLLQALTPLLASFVVFPALVVIYARKYPPAKKGHCPVCDYNLTGTVSGRCPECGTPIAAGAAPPGPPGPAEEKKPE